MRSLTYSFPAVHVCYRSILGSLEKLDRRLIEAAFDLGAGQLAHPHPGNPATMPCLAYLGWE